MSEAEAKANGHTISVLEPTTSATRPLSAQSSSEKASIHSESKTAVESNETEKSEDVEAMARTDTQPEPIYTVFPLGIRRFVVAMATLSGIFSTFTSFIFLPAIDTLARYYGVSVGQINLAITTYQILQGVAPMWFGNAADSVGRRPVYIACFIVYLGANLGLALQNSFAALLVLRAMQSAGSSPTIALGNAVVADVAPISERASWMGYVTSGILLGPAIAPTVGGLLTQFLGWRWMFWFLLIVNGVYLTIYIIINPETCRKVVDDGSLPPPKLNESGLDKIRRARRKAKGIPEPELSEERKQKSAELEAERKKFRFPNPMESLKCLAEPDVAMVMFYQAIMIAAFYMIMVPITPVFADVYGFNELQIGLCYIPFAAGSAAGSIGFGRLLNWNFARTARKLGMKVDRKRAAQIREFPIERARLEFIVYPNALAAAGLLCWGWTLEQRPNLAGPLIILVFTALGSTGSSVIVNTLLVDLYPHSPATVIAANNLLRCLFGAAASAIIQYMINAMGLGWCYTLIAAVTMLATLPLLATMRYGPKWREARAVRSEKKEAEKKAKEQAKKEVKEQKRAFKEQEKMEKEKE